MTGVGREKAALDEDAWSRFCADLAASGAEVYRAARALDPPAEPADVTRHLLWTLLQAGTIAASALDPDRPDWVPLMNSANRAGNPSPDAVYYLARIRATGYYRIGGSRGTMRFVYLSLHDGYLAVTDRSGRSYSTISVDDLQVAANGTFEVLVGPSRPVGHTGNFLATDPRCVDTFVLIRQLTSSAADEVDGRFFIEVADELGSEAAGAGRPDMTERLAQVPRYVERFGRAMVKAIGSQREVIAALNKVGDYSAGLSGTPIMPHQTYLAGLLEVPDDQALIVETVVPASCTYWSVQLMDSFYNALDFRFAQTGLSSASAEVGPGGRLVVVVSRTDPQVRNWLDKGRHRLNLIRWRWLGVEQPPEVITSRVATAELAARLSGADRVTREARGEDLRSRARRQQLRRRW